VAGVGSAGEFCLDGIKEGPKLGVDPIGRHTGRSICRFMSSRARVQ